MLPRPYPVPHSPSVHLPFLRIFLYGMDARRGIRHLLSDSAQRSVSSKTHAFQRLLQFFGLKNTDASWIWCKELLCLGWVVPLVGSPALRKPSERHACPRFSLIACFALPTTVSSDGTIRAACFRKPSRITDVRSRAQPRIQNLNGL